MLQDCQGQVLSNAIVGPWGAKPLSGYIHKEIGRCAKQDPARFLQRTINATTSIRSAKITPCIPLPTKSISLKRETGERMICVAYLHPKHGNWQMRAFVPFLEMASWHRHQTAAAENDVSFASEP